MQIIAILSPAIGVGPEAIKAHAVEENRAVWALYRSGSLRDMHFRTDRPGAVFRLEAASTDEANAMLANLPMIQMGLLVPELIPVGPFIPLENLFAPTE